MSGQGRGPSKSLRAKAGDEAGEGGSRAQNKIFPGGKSGQGGWAGEVAPDSAESTYM